MTSFTSTCLIFLLSSLCILSLTSAKSIDVSELEYSLPQLITLSTTITTNNNNDNNNNNNNNEQHISRRAPVPGIYEMPSKDFPTGQGVPLILNPIAIDNEFENYYERMTRLWYNFVRISPLYFRDVMMPPLLNDNSLSQVFNTSTYTSTALLPLGFSLNLNRLARAHVFDRVACPSTAGTTPHFDCNNTSPTTRFGDYARTLGGPIEIFTYLYPQATVFSPRLLGLASIAAFICDGGISATYKLGQCCTDLGNKTAAPLGCASGGDGHRSAIMTVHGQSGCGVAWDSARTKAAVTCNTSGQLKNPSAGGYAVNYTNVIYTAGHTFQFKNSSIYYFIANIYTNTSTILNASVIVGDVAVPLTLLAGSSNRGNFVSKNFTDKWSVLPSRKGRDNCTAYYFHVETQSPSGNKTVYRYPTEGFFYTYYVSGCDINYDNGGLFDGTTDGASGEGSSASAGTVAGAVIGSLVLVVLVVVGVVLYTRSRNSKPKMTKNGSNSDILALK